MIQQLLAVLFVMGLLFAGLQLLRRRGLAQFRTGLRLRKTPRRLELLEKLPLTAQHSLHVVRMDGRSLLIGVSPSGCALLESRPGEAAAGEPA
jgi:flagellar biogenesis protein FliO